jgi:hypothetical protein
VCLIGLPAGVSASARHVEIEAGIVVDVFSESYGSGDLFGDLDQLPGTTDEVDPEEPLRIRNDETLVGGTMTVGWSPDDTYERRLEVSYEQNDASAAGDVEGRWRFGRDHGWTLDVEERLRLQFGLETDDRSRDVLQAIDLSLSRRVRSLGTLTFTADQSFSRVSGDSLSRLFDYTIHGLGARLDRALGSVDARWKLDWSYRDAAGDFSSNDHRVRAGAELHRYAFSGLGFDAVLLATRRAYDERGVVSPSNVEGEADVRVSHPVGGGIALVVDGDVTEVRFDAPDPTYFDYGVSHVEAGASWSSLGGVKLDLAGAGEWLRPRSGSSGAYDQSGVRLGMSFFGARGVWIDVEEHLGTRRYLGGSSTGGLLVDQGTLDLSTSDFFFSELSLLLGTTLGRLSLDAYAQYTFEDHADVADDVSFVLVNMRLTSRF